MQQRINKAIKHSEQHSQRSTTGSVDRAEELSTIKRIKVVRG